MKIVNHTDATNIAPVYTPIVDAAVAAYRLHLGSALLSVRLLGSVARGEAVPGRSDVDFLALVTEPPPAAALTALARVETALVSQYPVASRVDMEVVEESTMPEVRQFILATDSILVHGADAIPHGIAHISRERLTRLVTLPAIDLARSYRSAVAETEDPAQLLRYARVTGKDLLRSLRGRALQRGAPYEAGIGAIYRTVVEYVPEHRALAEELYALCHCEDVRKEDLLALLCRAERALP